MVQDSRLTPDSLISVPNVAAEASFLRSNPKWL